MRQRNRSLEVYKRKVVSLSRRKGRKKRETPKIGVYLIHSAAIASKNVRLKTSFYK